MNPYGKILISALLTLVSVFSWGQSSKIYTKKARMEDFPVRTTKVVLSGQSLLDITLKDEISARWSASPFEFCTIAQYENLKDDNSYYFLRLVREDGVAFLSLSKGGKENETDNLKKPFEVVRIAIAPDGSTAGREFAFMGAFVDIVQKFAEDAMRTDMIGLAGLAHYNKVSLNGREISFNENIGNKLMTEGDSDALVALVIAPLDISFTSRCYKMLISADTHELYYYRRNKYTGPKDKAFTEQEYKRFAKRNGKLAR